MNLENFVKNIKFYCSTKGVKPTVACREAGVGQSFINNMELKGSIPSVEKVQLLAQYLGVTTSELLGESATVHDSAVVLRPSDVKRLTVNEVKMVMAYRAASPEIRRIIDGALEPYRDKKETSAG